MKKEPTAFDVATAGLGYVGLPLALQFAESGANVLGLDIDPEKVRKLGKGESYLMHVEGARIGRLVQSGQLTASTEFSRDNPFSWGEKGSLPERLAGSSLRCNLVPMEEPGSYPWTYHSRRRESGTFARRKGPPPIFQ